MYKRATQSRVESTLKSTTHILVYGVDRLESKLGRLEDLSVQRADPQHPAEVKRRGGPEGRIGSWSPGHLRIGELPKKKKNPGRPCDRAGRNWTTRHSGLRVRGDSRREGKRVSADYALRLGIRTRRPGKRGHPERPGCCAWTEAPPGCSQPATDCM
ncbi:hypothetical protein NDU88_007410 [Pleurodeles waltl]|uniref:Uncharacterized protein n=1 Tax=Pleurodeles waltl TaxID=8319 RepID=A0AAV7NXB1_PLEWA|nr:hypothetical protein NDU88_007410 [Pleurodeles waltl]